MRNKNVYMYIVLILIIIFSFAIPSLVMKLTEEKIFAGKYEIYKKVYALNNKANKNDIIKAIYSRYDNNSKYNVSVSDYAQGIPNILRIENNQATILDEKGFLNKFLELIKLNIVKDSFLYDLAKENEIIYRIWEYDNGEITYRKVNFFTDSDYFKYAIASMEIEDDTDKVIVFTINRKYLNINKESMYNYINYLGMSEFEDWKHKDNMMLSEEAGVKVTSTNEGELTCCKVEVMR